MDVRHIGQAIGRRKILLAAIVAVSALAALPIALGAETTYSSKGEVLIPSLAPLPRIPPAVSASVITSRLDDYLASGLEKDVKEALGAGPDVEIAAGQNLDTSLITVTAGSPSEDRAVEAARSGVREVVRHAGSIGDAMVDELTERLGEHLEPIEEQLARVEESSREVNSSFSQIQQERQGLAAQLNAARQGLVRAEAQQDDEAASGFEAQIAQLEEDLDDAEARSVDAEGRAASVNARLALLRSRRESLVGLSQEATALQVALSTTHSITEPPRTASSDDLQNVALIMLMAVLVGSLVGVIAVLFLERRRMKRVEA